MIRINAMPGVSPVVTECMTRFNQLSLGVFSNLTHMFLEILNVIPGSDFINLVDATSSSNNVKTKVKNIANVLFKSCVNRIEELRSQLEKMRISVRKSLS